jgi:hypothetical protein
MLPGQVTFPGFVALAAATAAVVEKPVKHRQESPDQAVGQAFLVAAATQPLVGRPARYETAEPLVDALGAELHFMNTTSE